MWLDIAKGVAILLTIIGHTVPMNGNIRKIIYSFHMPLFFLLSGYTFRQVSASEIKAQIKKDIKRLLLPYIYCCGVDVLIGTVFGGRSFLQIAAAYALGYTGNYLGLPAVGTLWFMPALFWAKTVYRFVLLYVEKYRQMFILMTAFAGIWIGQSIWLPQSLDFIFVILIFMETGYLLKQWSCNSKDSWKQGTIQKVFGVVAFFAWTWYLGSGNGGYKIDVSIRIFDKYTLGILMAVLASICVIQFCRSVENWKMVSGIAFLGKHTLAIFYIHKFDWILWKRDGRMVMALQNCLKDILSSRDFMGKYDSWCNIMTNGVVILQRVLLNILVLLVYLYIKEFASKLSARAISLGDSKAEMKK